MKRYVSCLLMLLMCLPSAWPASSSTDPREDRPNNLAEGSSAAKAKYQVQKRGVGEKSKVKVTLRDRTEVKGYISQIDADSFQVTDKKSGRVTTIAYGDAVKVRKNGLSTAAKIGIGAAAVGGAMIVLGLIAFQLAGD